MTCPRTPPLDGPGLRVSASGVGGAPLSGGLRRAWIHLPCGMVAQKTAFSPAPAGARDWVDLGGVATDLPEPALVTLSIKGGEVRLQTQDAPAPLLIADGSQIFGHSAGGHSSVRVRGPRPEIVVLVIPMKGLDPLVGSAFANDLLQALGIPGPGTFAPLPMPAHLIEVHQNILPVGLNERASALYASAKALEYLSFLSEHMDSGPQPHPKQTVPLLNAQTLRQRLQTKDPEAWSAESLASHFQVSCRRIREFFKQEFGMSLYAFLTQQHLEQARVEILATDVPLKELAAHLGYSHVNNFTTAFRNHFGYPPGRLRRRDPLGQAASD